MMRAPRPRTAASSSARRCGSSASKPSDSTHTRALRPSWARAWTRWKSARLVAMRVPPPKPAVTALIFSCTAAESRCSSGVTSASRVWKTNTRASTVPTKARAMRRNSCACVSIERLTSTRMNRRGFSRRCRRQAGASGRPPVFRLARKVRRRSSLAPRGSSRQRRVRRSRRRRAMRSASRCSCARSCGSHSASDRSCSASVRLAPPWARGAPASCSSPAGSATAVSSARAPGSRRGASIASCSDSTTCRRSREGRVWPLTRTDPLCRCGYQ